MYMLTIDPMPNHNYNEIINFLNKNKIIFKLEDSKIILDDKIINSLFNKDLVKNILILEDNDGSTQELYYDKKYSLIKSGILIIIKN